MMATSPGRSKFRHVTWDDFIADMWSLDGSGVYDIHGCIYTCVLLDVDRDADVDAKEKDCFG